MEYWTYNLKTKKPGIFGSLPPLREYVGCTIAQLERPFSRQKKTDVTINDIRIVKLKPIRAYRNRILTND